MGNSETITASTLVVDAHHMPAPDTPVPIEPIEAAYMYTRANGVVETAVSAKDAFERCPVLGRLAMVAPEQATSLLELMATGQKIQAEAQGVPKKQDTEKRPEPELRVEPVWVDNRPLVKPIDTIPMHRAETPRQAVVTLPVFEPKHETVHKVHEIAEKIPDIKVPIAKKPNQKVKIEKPPAAEIKQEPAMTVVEAIEPIDTRSTPVTVDELEVTPEGVYAAAEDKPEITPILRTTTDSGYTAEQCELTPEPAAVETHTELTAIIVESEEAESPIEDFKTYMAVTAQSISEQPARLEIIQEQAHEQPLEQTFTQLVAVLVEAIKVPAQSELREVYDILQEIEIALPACYVEQETGEVTVQITPALTETVLRLLHSLGYENPREALAECVRQRGVAFVLQALQYMCQFNDEDSRREFVTSPAVTTTTDTSDVRFRLAKMLFALISRVSFEPAA